jgi:hypothetical protein
MKGVVAVAALFVLTVPSTGIAQSALDATAGINTFKQTPSSALVTLASAVLPGSGQAFLGQRRGAAYLALEAAGIAYYVSQNRDGNRQRREYRSLARNVARAGLSSSGPGGSWDYYERMEKYVASGAFDRVPGGDVDPEIDAETFNGAMWLLARQTYWRDPAVAPSPQSTEYRAAVDFYLHRAVTPEFLWSWSANPSAFQSYRAAIAGSNRAFRNAEQTVSLLLANHFLSAIDAFASVQMRVRRDGQGTTTLSASLRF